MTLSRWKIMAVGLGVSIGALAAMAGQCPKADSSKGRTAEAPPALDLPVIPAAAPKTTPPALPDLPPPPLPSTGGPVAGPVPVVPPAHGADSLPSLPTPVAEPVKKLDVPVGIPSSLPVLPTGGSELPKPMTPDKPPMKVTPPLPPMTAPDLTPPTNAAAALRPDIRDPLIAPPAPTPPTIVPDGGTTSMEIKRAKASALKYRILLRVGEGEPSFEVKCGDDLVLKVLCEKVDIKSPEKGMSVVKASGKVRFAGFGAEGVCGELSFVTGTGEVLLAGDVNIKVKDKLGRVESEFTTAAVTYKLDPSPAGSR